MHLRESFAYQIYLYLWPFWLFRDAQRGSLLERAAAYRHNRAQRVHLPGYALKWAVLAGLQGGLLLGVETANRALAGAVDALATLLSAGLGTSVSVSVVVVAVCLAAWGYLTWVEG